MPPLAVIVVIGLASLRLTLLITTDSITAPLRDWLYDFAWDEERMVTQRDGFVEPTPRAPWRTYVHELFTCPWCMGLWMSVIVYVLWDHGGSVGRTAVAVAAVAGLQIIGVAITNHRKADH